jgi:predicted MFS family arabinose efflux permease
VASDDGAGVTPARTGFGPLFANRHFLVMWLGQVFSQTADKLVFILLVEIVGDLSSSPRVMSTALALHTTPNMVLGAIAGVAVDRLDKRQVMVATNVARLALVAALGTWGPHSLVTAIALAFAISCCAQPFIPAEAAAMPLVVGKDHLLSANSLFATTMIGSIIVAFTLGEPLVQWLGTSHASYVTAAGFAVSVAFLACVRYRYPDQRADEREGFWQQLVEGFRYIRATPAIQRTLVLQIALFGMFAAMSVLAIIFAKTVLHANFSWFLAMAGAGLGLGAAVIGQLGSAWNKALVVTFGFTACGLALATLAATGGRSIEAAFAIALVLGISAALAAVPLQTRLQELVSEERRGKVFGAQNTLLNIATTLPLATAGFLVERLGIQQVIAAVGALMLLAAGWGWWTRRADV